MNNRVFSGNYLRKLIYLSKRVLRLINYLIISKMPVGKKIIVTGGMGYIGSHTVVELFESGYIPVVIDNFSNSSRQVPDALSKITGTKIQLYEGDCTDKKFLKGVFNIEGKVEGVIHFAAFKAVGESVAEPLKYYRNNIASTVSLLEAMAEVKCPQIIFSSSATVYGQPDCLPVTEQTPKKQAESPYGNCKQVCEEILEDVVKSRNPVKAICLRYFNPIGAHPSSLIGELPFGVPNNLVPFITQTAAGIRETLTVFGNDYNTNDGTCIRDYIHVVDLAKAHVKALNYLENISDAGFFDIFNIGTGKGYSVLEVIRAFEKASGKKLNYKIGSRRKGDIEAIYANADKAERVLGWKAISSMEDALRDAWNWQKRL